MSVDVLNYYPFSGLHGMDAAKEAVICAMVNPKIKTILIRGKSGTGKTALARSVAGVVGKKLINIPLNVTEEQLFGSLDLESLLKDSSVNLNDSVLMRADNNLVYLDDAGLLDHRMLKMLIGSINEGKVLVERDNVSAKYSLNTTLIASINSSGSPLPQSIMDDFDVSINVYASDDPNVRKKIAESQMSYMEDPHSFNKLHENQEREISLRVQNARSLLPQVSISKGLTRAISKIAKEYHVQGYRGEIATINMSLAFAALDGRTAVENSDVEKAAVLCIYHRKRRFKDETDKTPAPEKESLIPPASPPVNLTESNDSQIPAETDDVNPDDIVGFGDDLLLSQIEARELVFKIGERFEAIDLIEEMEKDIDTQRKTVRSVDGRGKMVGSEEYEGGTLDLALGATVRTAIPYQRERVAENNRNLAIIIKMDDVRSKIREVRKQRTLLFVIDASSSLIIRSRMTDVKTSVMAMLDKMHNRRDRVGIVRFSEGDIKVIMHPTRHVGTIAGVLDNLAIGTKTPLSEALVFSYDYMLNYIRKYPGEECYVILITDGRANIPMEEGNDPIEEALQIAEKLHIPNMRWIVIDTGIGYSKTDVPERLANRLRAWYYTLDDLRSN